jgi:protein involved in polysaccharide export with SLBB domain
MKALFLKDLDRRGGQPRRSTRCASVTEQMSPTSQPSDGRPLGALARNVLLGVLAAAAFVVAPARAAAQHTVSARSPLTSRAELDSIAKTAERLAMTGEDPERNSLLAAQTRERLREGDFQTGDRIAVTVQIDTAHTDTLVVRAGRVLQIPGGLPAVALAGVLRSELQPLVSSEVLKYVKARRVDAVPLMRLSVAGEVARPNFYDFNSDLPLTNVIMAAGGPTATADLTRSSLRRGGADLHSSQEISTAMQHGLTLDQFGLQAGDELVIGRRKEFNFSQYLTYITAIGGLATLFITIHARR